nr:probable inactive protein kinase DDB_G0270444 [Ipomoea batatas]
MARPDKMLLGKCMDAYELMSRAIYVCARKITKLFKERTNPNGYTWGQLSVDTVEFYWEEFKEQVATQREMLTGTGEQVDDNQLYYDVVGGHDKKRRIYGLGSYGCSIVNGSTSDNTSGNMTPTSRPPDNATLASVQDEIQSLKATILLMQQRLDAIDGGRAGTSSSPPSQTD